MTTNTPNHGRRILVVLDAREALQQPTTALQLAKRVDFTRKAADNLLRSLHKLGKVRPLGLQERTKGVAGTAAMLWQWVDE